MSGFALDSFALSHFSFSVLLNIPPPLLPASHFWLSVLEIASRTSCMLGKHSPTKLYLNLLCSSFLSFLKLYFCQFVENPIQSIPIVFILLSNSSKIQPSYLPYLSNFQSLTSSSSALLHHLVHYWEWRQGLPTKCADLLRVISLKKLTLFHLYFSEFLLPHQYLQKSIFQNFHGLRSFVKSL